MKKHKAVKLHGECDICGRKRLLAKHRIGKVLVGSLCKPCREIK